MFCLLGCDLCLAIWLVCGPPDCELSCWNTHQGRRLCANLHAEAGSTGRACISTSRRSVNGSPRAHLCVPLGLHVTNVACRAAHDGSGSGRPLRCSPHGPCSRIGWAGRCGAWRLHLQHPDVLICGSGALKSPCWEKVGTSESLLNYFLALAPGLTPTIMA